MPFNKNHPSFVSLRAIVTEARAPVVFWIGAGVSSDAGIPNWKQLRKKLCLDALEEITTREKDEADLLEAQLEEAANTEDLWSAFETIKNILGDPTFKSTIRRTLAPAESEPVPLVHRRIWQLPSVKGVVTLNLDGLEKRAHGLDRSAEHIEAFIGRDLRSHLSTFKVHRPFIARLHGYHSDATSWVFTRSDLSRLLSGGAYEAAVRSIFSSYTVVFLGISANDVAAGGFLGSLSSMGVDTGDHFWITNKNDQETRQWANNAGIQKIIYHVGDGETHTSELCKIFDELSSYKSVDQPAAPISYRGAAAKSIRSPRELKSLEEDEVRRELNSYAKHLLDESANKTDTTLYQDFLTEYSPAIHQSWHVSNAQGYDRFFGYKVVEKIHSGPFFLNLESTR